MKVIPDTRRARTEFDIYVLITETLKQFIPETHRVLT
jgi:hypothetical protein